MRIVLDEMLEKNNRTTYSVTISSEGSIVVANDNFYSFIGSNSCYKLQELVHEEDREEFCQIMSELDEEVLHSVTRIRGIEDKYLLFYLTFKKDYNEAVGEKYIAIEIMELLSLVKRNEVIEGLTRKYRRLLGFEKKSYFEYDVDKEELVIYMYVNDKSIVLLRDNIDHWYEYALSKGRVSDSDKLAFESFYLNLKSGMNDFILTMSDGVFYDNAVDEPSTVKGSMIFVNGKRVYSVGIITPKVVNEDEMNTQYFISDLKRDAATGLYNKKAIVEYVTDTIAKKRERNFYFAIIDIDDFKRINDTYGHMFGDEVILKLAEILKSAVNGYGVAGRFGGDEFVLLLENMNEDKFRNALKTIHKNMAWAFRNTDKKLDVTLSIGASEYPSQADTYERLFAIADKCLYMAKDKGKARYIIYTPSKHGQFVFDEKTNVSGGKEIVSFDAKTKLISDILFKLSDDGTKDLEDHLESMRHNFDIDSITIYTGDKLSSGMRIGTLKKNIDSLCDSFEKEYFDLFADDVFNLTNIHNIEKEFPLAYSAIAECGITQWMQVFVKGENGKQVLVSFNVVDRTIKRSTFDVSLLSLIGRYICKVMIEGR